MGSSENHFVALAIRAWGVHPEVFESRTKQSFDKALEQATNACGITNEELESRIKRSFEKVLEETSEKLKSEIISLKDVNYEIQRENKTLAHCLEAKRSLESASHLEECIIHRDNAQWATTTVMEAIDDLANSSDSGTRDYSKRLRDDFTQHVNKQIQDFFCFHLDPFHGYETDRRYTEPPETESETRITEILRCLEALASLRHVDVGFLDSLYTTIHQFGVRFSSDIGPSGFLVREGRWQFYRRLDEVLLAIEKRIWANGDQARNFEREIEEMNTANDLLSSLEIDALGRRDPGPLPVGIFTRSLWFQEDACAFRAIVTARKYISARIPEELAEMILNQLASPTDSSYVDLFDKFASRDQSGPHSPAPDLLISMYQPWPKIENHPDFKDCYDFCVYSGDHWKRSLPTTCPCISTVYWCKDLKQFQTAHGEILCRHSPCKGHHESDTEWEIDWNDLACIENCDEFIDELGRFPDIDVDLWLDEDLRGSEEEDDEDEYFWEDSSSEDRDWVNELTPDDF